MKLNVLQKFTVLSLGATVIVVVGLSLLVTSLLTSWLFEHEATITGQALRAVTAVDLPANVFGRAIRDNDTRVFEYIWQHLQRIPDVFRIKFYDSTGKVVWSDERRLIGKTYEGNEELERALLGRIVVEMGRLKEEHEFERHVAPEQEILEVYVPLIGERDQRYGVVELYKYPIDFLRSKRTLLMIVWGGGAASGLILYLSLFGLFRGALRAQRRLEEVERRYHEVEVELKVAGTIQKRLLPPELPAMAGFDMAAHHEPSRQIGGDYYDAFWAKDGTLALAVADSEGKGIPGALMMVETRQLLRASVDVTTCACTTVEALNESLSVDKGPARFVTMFLARLDPATKMLRYCNAGHCPGLLAREGQVTRLDVGGMPLGVVPASGYEEGICRLAAGDVVLLYTDGITEAANSEGEMFGMERLQGTLRRLAGLGSAAAVLHGVNAAVAGFIGGQSPSDDVTVMCLTVTA